jgi:DNA-binding transcriptional regulator YdaS (Cro superfamily)
MSFKSYYDDLSAGQKKELSEKMKVTLGFLSQLATGHRKAGVHVIAKIEKATNGALTRAEIRPDIFGV